MTLTERCFHNVRLNGDRALVHEDEARPSIVGHGMRAATNRGQIPHLQYEEFRMNTQTMIQEVVSKTECGLTPMMS